MRQRQRGSAMMVTMIITVALLAGVSVLVSMQVSSNRATDVTKTGMAATYCAEAGLTIAAPYVAANYLLWGVAGNMCTSRPTTACTQPAWLDNTKFSHRLDSTESNALPDEFKVFITDNDDETGVNDPTKDIDLRIFIVSRCVKYPDFPREVEELVQYSGGGGSYKSQVGGNQGNGNDN